MSERSTIGLKWDTPTNTPIQHFAFTISKLVKRYPTIITIHEFLLWATDEKAYLHTCIREQLQLFCKDGMVTIPHRLDCNLCTLQNSVF